jgi:23S rRNA pseudouridine1911/1915/1917 synthase
MIEEKNENESLLFHSSAPDVGKRLDLFLSEKIEGWSRSRLQQLIDDEDILVNSKKTKSSYRLSVGDEIEVELVEAPTDNFEPENIPLDIIFEDEYLAVINKPAGMIVHPGAGVKSGTLANAIAYHFNFKSSAETATAENYRIGIVHRLDKDTSGLILVAKNDRTHETLAKQFRDREVFKSYVALVHGAMRGTKGKVDQPIGRDRYNRIKMSVTKTGRNAVSLWKVRKNFEKFTLLDVEIKTGRTHQIRVHLGFLNHPIVGDDIYNEGRDNTVNDLELNRAISKLGRFFLHAERLIFTHPVSKQKMDFTSPLPRELTELVNLL